MPRRTAEANRAVLEAWQREQALVREGRGTRDWTPEQQQDILERGRAYDAAGKAFEGHHMKSVEAFPEYQGDLDNIQFLSRSEHRAAHNGNFQFPTNGCYNPDTGETRGFGDNIYERCEIIPLSIPIKGGGLKSEELPKGQTEALPADDPRSNIETFDSKKTKENIKEKLVSHSKELIHKAKNGKIVRFVVQHGPEIKTGAKILFWTAVTWLAGEALEKISEGSSSHGSNSDGTDCSPSAITDADLHREGLAAEEADTVLTIEETPHKEKRKSPREHTVNDPGQRYHYKDGSIRYREKQPYERGVKENDQ